MENEKEEYGHQPRMYFNRSYVRTVWRLWMKFYVDESNTDSHRSTIERFFENSFKVKAFEKNLEKFTQGTEKSKTYLRFLFTKVEDAYELSGQVIC